MISIGVPKGYLYEESLDYFRRHGLAVGSCPERALCFYDKEKQYRFMILRPTDVPVYIEHGIIDMGICGMDIIKEESPDLLVLKDLGFGKCRLSICGSCDFDKKNLAGGVKVATKFTNITKKYFQDEGIKADIIKLYGSVELAAFTGLSDVIVDLVATGKTLQENNLKEISVIFESTAHLVVNQAFYNLNFETVKRFCS